MSIPIIDTDGTDWEHRSAVSSSEKRKYCHIERARELEVVVREKEDGSYVVLLIQMGSRIQEEKHDIQDTVEANQIARDWMVEYEEM